MILRKASPAILWKVFNRIALALLIIAALFPLYIMVIGSFKNQIALYEIPPDVLPFKVNSDNFLYIFKEPIARWMLNSFIISASISIITIFIDSLAGYVFAKKSFPGKKFLFVLVVCTMILPIQILMVPMFVIVKTLHMYNNFLGVILPSCTAPFGVFLMRQYIKTIPDEIIEAANIDGAHEVSIFFNIIIPLSLPAVGVLAIFNFISSWNDYMWQLIVLTSSKNWTMPLALAGMVSKYHKNIGYQLAGSVIACIPMIIIFLALQKSLIRGLSAGAVKG